MKLFEIIKAKDLKLNDVVVLPAGPRTVYEFVQCRGAGLFHYGEYGYLKLHRTYWAKQEVLERTADNFSRRIGIKLGAIIPNPIEDDPDYEWIWTFSDIPYIRVVSPQEKLV